MRLARLLAGWAARRDACVWCESCSGAPAVTVPPYPSAWCVVPGAPGPLPAPELSFAADDVLLLIRVSPTHALSLRTPLCCRLSYFAALRLPPCGGAPAA